MLIRLISACYMHKKVIDSFEKDMKKKNPDCKTDAGAETFVDTADLNQYDLSGFMPLHFVPQSRPAHAKKRPVRATM